MYGFRGDFIGRPIEMARPAAKTLYVGPARNSAAKLKRKILTWAGSYSHIIWELEAQK